MRYKQCTLRKGNTCRTTWLPSCYAVVGATLQLRDDEEWTDGWVVEETSKNSLDEVNLPDSHRQIKAHRKNTGDSQKRVLHDT